tara:strand:- start:14326 stop:16020 length:1695 start_codon:yes stop_codon:yes gene_type:complete
MKKLFRNTYFKDCLLLTILIGILFGFMLGTRPLNTPDEGRYSEVSREMVATGDYVTPRVNDIVFLDKPPMAYWLQSVSIHAFGLNRWALRLPIALVALLGCLFTYWAAREFYDRRAGWIAAISLSTGILYFAIAHYVNMDMEVAVFISCGLLLFLMGANAPPGREKSALMLGAYVAAAFAILTKGLIGIAFPAMIIGLWVLLLNRWRILLQMRLLAGLIIILVICAPWFYAVQQANPEFLHYFFIFQQFDRFTGQGFNGSAPFWFYLPIIIVGFLPWISYFVPAVMKKISWRQRQANSTEYFLIIWIVAVTVFFSVPNSKLVSYIIPVFPPMAILTAGYLSQNWHDIKALTWPTRLCGFLLVFVGIGFFMAARIVPAQAHVDLTEARFALEIIAMLYIAGAVGVNLWLRDNFVHSFRILILMMVVMLWITLAAAPSAIPGSSLPLAQQLKMRLQPGDKVVAYNNFFQDLPLYLQHKVVTVANWDDINLKHQDNAVGQLAWGMQYKPQSRQWMWTPSQFVQHWNGKQRLYVVLKNRDLKQFAIAVKGHYRIIAKASTMVLVVNRA